MKIDFAIRVTRRSSADEVEKEIYRFTDMVEELENQTKKNVDYLEYLLDEARSGVSRSVEISITQVIRNLEDIKKLAVAGGLAPFSKLMDVAENAIDEYSPSQVDLLEDFAVGMMGKKMAKSLGQIADLCSKEIAKAESKLARLKDKMMLGSTTMIANELVGMAKELTAVTFSEVDDVGLQRLKELGGWSFSPRFASGINFILTKEGIFVRGPYGAETFRAIPIRHAVMELGLRDAPELVQQAFNYFTGSYLILLDRLLKSGQYLAKKIT